jgi:HAD superfamily hydrolase (TIGR01509 family)
MPQIVLVLFDMHDVLCRYDKPKRLAGLSQLSGKAAAAIDAAIWQSGFETQADCGKLDDEAYLAGFGARLGYPITLREWLDNRRACMTPMPDILALLPRIKAKIAVLTNNHTLVRDHLDFLFPEIFSFCGADAYVSAQFGAAKPDPRVYLACAAAAGAAPAETLFIDDSAGNVAGAISAGMAGHVFTGAAALIAVLKTYGLL